MSENLMPWHKTWLVDIEYDRVDLVKEGANSQAFIKLAKAKGGTSMDFEQILKGLKPEHQATVLAYFEAEINKAKADAETAKEEAVAKAKADFEASQVPAGQSQEDILKSVKDPAVRALLETQIAKTVAAEAKAALIQEQQLDRDAVVKAKEVSGLGAEETALVEVYKKLNKLSPAVCEDVFGILKAASEVTKAGGVFTEIGKTASHQEGGVSADAAWGKIEAAATELAKSRNLTQANAVKEVMKSNPELYEAYVKAQQGE